MLILVSVTVTVAINGGLFEYAGNAKYDTEVASEKETIQKAAIIAEGSSKTGRVTVEEMQKAINKEVNESSAIAIDNGDTIAVKFNDSNRYYYVDSKGNVTGPIEIVFDTEPGKLDGTGTEEDPFVIMSIEDLVFVSKQVNTNQTGYPSAYYILGKTLDFNSDLSYVNPNTKEYDEYLGGDGTTGLKEQLTKGNGFIPIGSDSSGFRGIFDGRNNEIKNLYEKNIESGGLFGIVNGGTETEPTTIMNLTIHGDISATNNAGGIISKMSIGYSVLENIQNYVKVNSTGGNVGGMIGLTTNYVTLNGCSNYGNIVNTNSTTGQEESCGGLIGYANRGTYKIISCANFGKITGVDNYAYDGTAGIIGGIWVPSKLEIYNTYNFGEINGNLRVGGIVGQYSSSQNFYIENVFNTGLVTASWTPGGLVGATRDLTPGASTTLNSYYISTCTKGVGNWSIEVGTQYTEEQLHVSEFVDNLNLYITSNTHTTGWAKWVYNENSYPTLDTTTTWDATTKTWVKK